MSRLTLTKRKKKRWITETILESTFYGHSLVLCVFPIAGCLWLFFSSFFFRFLHFLWYHHQSLKSNDQGDWVHIQRCNLAYPTRNTVPRLHNSTIWSAVDSNTTETLPPLRQADAFQHIFFSPWSCAKKKKPNKKVVCSYFCLFFVFIYFIFFKKWKKLQKKNVKKTAMTNFWKRGKSKIRWGKKYRRVFGTHHVSPLQVCLIFFFNAMIAFCLLCACVCVCVLLASFVRISLHF